MYWPSNTSTPSRSEFFLQPKYYVGMVGGRDGESKGGWEARRLGGREGVGSTTGIGMLLYSLILMMLAWYDIKIMWCTMHYVALHQH